MAKANGSSAKARVVARTSARTNGSKLNGTSRKKLNGGALPKRKRVRARHAGEGYRPSEDEPFMGKRQRTYFQKKLLLWKDDIVRQTRETLVALHQNSVQHADITDRATSEADRTLELRARDRQRKLVAKINSALARIDDGSYGYCEDTGEPISLKRLDARPIATLSLEAQERHERRERVYRND
jgi:DnaK suppressor protein